MNHPDIVKLFIHDERALPAIFTIHTLDRAAHFGDVELVRFLLSYPVFSQIVNLVVTGGDILSIKTLVEAGYKIDQETLGRALRYAENNGNENVVQYLKSLKNTQNTSD
jgi:hypothetical protein